MIYLSFDIEEFDAPIDFGLEVDEMTQMEVSQRGCIAVLDLLKEEQVAATFFSTLKFATASKNIISRIINEGHELASHGVEHSCFEEADLAESRQGLEALALSLGHRTAVRGFRMPRMQAVDKYALVRSGYSYDASLNPTWIPGRYNHLGKPTKPFIDEAGILQLPASVTPQLRIPLFWLMFHNLPVAVFQWLVKQTYSRQRYLNIYFHPWEFVALCKEPSATKLPSYMKRNTGADAIARLRSLIVRLKSLGAPFGILSECKQG